MKKHTLIAVVIMVMVVGIIVVAVRRSATRGTEGVSSRVDLDRPLIVGVTSWPGYAGGILANGGFKENAQSIYTARYGLPVRFVLIEDIDARGKAFAKGGPDGIDIVWSTVDFWANELPGFIAGGINGKAFMQLDWSRGGDAMVAGASIKTVEDLKGKKIALTQFTPSHWLLEKALRTSHLTDGSREQIRKKLVFTQDTSSARSAFVAGHVDAAVVWEPDVKQALKRQGAYVLFSSRDHPTIIADVMVAKEEFLKAHPRAIEAFARGWFDGVEEAKLNPLAAAEVLVASEPLFADLGIEETIKSLDWAYLTGLADNVSMFGLDGRAPIFDSLFEETGAVWKSLGVVKEPLPASRAKDDSILRKIYPVR